MDMMIQYEQDSQMPGLAPMDTTPIPQSRAVEIVPTFVPTLSTTHPDLALHNPLHSPVSGLPFLPVQSESEILNNGFANTLHLPMSEIGIPFSNAAMEDVEPPQLHSTTAGFIPDMTSVVDSFIMVASEEKVGHSPDAHKLSLSPRSQVPSPSLHGATSSYFTGASSSLESALDPAATIAGRSRANTSISPPSHSPFSMSPSGLQNTTSIDLSSPPSTNSTLEASVSQQHPQTVIGKMLKDIAITAIDAGDAFENQEGAKRTTKVGELRDRIVQVLDMLAVMSLSESDLATSIVPPILTIPSEQPMGLSHPAVRSMESSGSEPIQQVSDQSRKRCASELEEHRNVKAMKMKREPTDDKPLSFPTNEVNHLPAAATAFPVPPVTAPVVFPVMQPPIPTIKQQAPLTATFPTFVAGSTSGPLTPLTNPTNVIPSIFPPLRSSWSDPVTTTSHQHSLSAGSITGPLVNQPPLPTTHLNTVSPTIPLLTLPQSTTVPIKPTTSVMGSPIGRMSRSGSINGTTFKNPYASFAYQDGHPDSPTWPSKMSSSLSRSGQSTWYMGSEPLNTFRRSSSDFTGLIPGTSRDSPQSDDDDEDEEEDSDDSNGKTVIHRTPSTTTDVPPEYRADVDKIFFEFLNRLCSNLDATDAKGEQIHQTLMAKKMQRLDESPDFRPFKFRIQAFTNSFLDELARQGYPEEKIPTKKVRNYLWRQQYILRFNEDGKKAKSKGNHIWIVEAKKAGDGQWEFRPFRRKLAGMPPSVAYCGMRWCWKPRVWDPQFSFKKIAVSFSSPSLPSWLTWKEGELCGTPPNNAENCQITAIAKFVMDNQDAQLSHTFNITIAIAPVLDSGYSNSHRSSAAGEQPPRRSTSDSALSQAPQRANLARSNRIDDTRVIRVLQSVAQRVTDEAESQFVSTLPPKQGELQALVKQKHVLEQTVEAYDKAISGQGHSQSRRLAVAAQHVVLQAARTVLADRTVAISGVTAPQAEAVGIQNVSVSELTDTTQDAIAMAVKMNGTTSNEVDIIVAATSILKARTSTHETSGVISPPTLIQASNTVPSSRIASTFPTSPLSTLPEYV